MILLAVCQHYHRGIFSDEWVEECYRKEVGNATTTAKEVRIHFFKRVVLTRRDERGCFLFYGEKISVLRDEKLFCFFFLANEVVDDTMLTVIVVPEDENIPCMTFKSEEVRKFCCFEPREPSRRSLLGF